ncbi:MAG: heavy-metal-associated domain-containing protein [Ruminococcaceae bacterium]|nr:heavy-metal-associated domain-containing protein [Oscillospiraceae bacterium]
MKKTYTLTELDCAHCAAKMESEIEKIKGVLSVNINFIAQKLTVEAEEKDFNQIIALAKEAIKKIEPDCEIES